MEGTEKITRQVLLSLGFTEKPGTDIQQYTKVHEGHVFQVLNEGSSFWYENPEKAHLRPVDEDDTVDTKLISTIQDLKELYLQETGVELTP